MMNWFYSTEKEEEVSNKEENESPVKEEGKIAVYFDFENVPTDVFYVVREFLLPKEFRRLMNANKTKFEAIRKFSNYYNLSNYYSWQYCTDVWFRKCLLKNIPGNFFQLSLTLIASYNPYQTRVVNEAALFENLYQLKLSLVEIKYEDLEKIKNVHHLLLLNLVITFNANNNSPLVSERFPKFENVRRLVVEGMHFSDVSNLSHIPNVSLRYSPVSDIEPLQFCEYLSFDNCRNLSMIECLGKFQKRLTFIDCPITEVGHLKKVPQLYFEKCSYLAHIEELDCCHSLTIKSCPKIFKLPSFAQFSYSHSHRDVHLDTRKKIILDNVPNVVGGFPWQSWENIQFLSLSNFQARNVFIPLTCLQTVQVIEINNCSNIIDVSVLGDVPSLSLSSLEDLISIQGLGKTNQKRVALANCPEVKDFSPLRNVTKVEIISCPHFERVSDVQQVSFLNLKLLPKLTSVREFAKCHSLQFISIILCSQLTSLAGLEEVPLIDIMDCGKLHDISSLGRLTTQVISFYGCPKIEKIKNLQRIALLKIENCPNIKDIHEMGRNLNLVCSKYSDLNRVNRTQKQNKNCSSSSFFSNFF
jgi:hypothetical protein